MRPTRGDSPDSLNMDAAEALRLYAVRMRRARSAGLVLANPPARANAAASHSVQGNREDRSTARWGPRHGFVRARHAGSQTSAAKAKAMSGRRHMTRR